MGFRWHCLGLQPDNKACIAIKPLALLMPLFERLIDLDLIELHSLQFGSDAEQLHPGVIARRSMNGKIVLQIFLILLSCYLSSIW